MDRISGDATSCGHFYTITSTIATREILPNFENVLVEHALHASMERMNPAYECRK